MKITGLNHINIFTCTPGRTMDFYTALGFNIGPRPLGFPDPGMWFYIDGNPVLHANVLTEVDFSSKLGAGVIGHVGFDVEGSIANVTDVLQKLEIEYDLGDPIPGVKRALYFHGPSGEYIELVFSEAASPHLTKLTMVDDHTPMPLADRVDNGTDTLTELAEIAEEQEAEGNFNPLFSFTR